MNPGAAVKSPSPQNKYPLWGALLETPLLFLAISGVLRSDNWLVVQVQNFALIVHIPILFLLESELGSAITAPFILFAGFAAMSFLWGFLISLVVKLVSRIAARLNPIQKKTVRVAMIAVGLLLLGSFGVSLLPARPRSFEASPETKSVVDANNAFAIDLYQQLKERRGNLFFSPYSVSSALAMTCTGARGPTEQEMTNTLHFGLPPEKLSAAFKGLTSRLTGLQRWNRITLSCANSLWAQKNYPFAESFVENLRENFSAETRLVDFRSSAADAAAEINRWIDAQTRHKIPGRFSPVQLSPDTRLALCNTIYFKGEWRHQFKKSKTHPAPFQVATNHSVTVPMMSQGASFKRVLLEDRSLELLELPYYGGDLSMVILLPGRFGSESDPELGVFELERKLTAENLKTWQAALDRKAPHTVSVRLPRFKMADSFNLVPELKGLGMSSAFDSAADFSGMDNSHQLYLSDVFHQTFVEVNETGTEAAAWTLATAKSKGKNDSFVVDHPFIFLVRDNSTGSILFLGRIIDPTK